MIYTATLAVGAFAETTAHLRGAPGFRTHVNAVLDDHTPDSSGGISTFQAGGIISGLWRRSRECRHTTLSPELRFADLWDAVSLNTLRDDLAPLLGRLGFDELDLGTLGSATIRSRELTRTCALHVHGILDQNGQPSFAGIRYRSRWGDQWECWAIFSDRIEHAAGAGPSSRTIPVTDPDLITCARTLGLRIEPDDQPNER